MSGLNQFLWAFIGLLLTVLGTFVEAFTTNPPWNWTENGIYLHSLGITYQIAAVLLTGCLGGKNAGAISQIAYVILGTIGLPIFARGGGLGYLGEPSFGYLVGFIPGAWICGYLAFRNRAKLELLAFSSLCGLSIVHLCGLIYLVVLSYLGTSDSLVIEDLPQMINRYSVAPIPGQLIMICAVAAIAFILRRVLFY